MQISFFHHKRRGWSRTDLLAVITTLAVLFLLGVPLVSQTRSNGSTAGCLNNLRKLTMGWQLYAEDHQGAMVAAGRHSGGTPPEWTGGEWLDQPINDPAEIDPELSVKRSPLWPYVQSTEAWRCPTDLSRASWPGYSWRPRVRSYSMNSWMGGPGWLASGSGWKVFQKITDIQNPTPSKAWVLIDERVDSINDGYFVVDMSGYQGDLRSIRIVDYPGYLHENGAGIGFADGHAEIWIWKDLRTTPREGPPLVLDVPSPTNRDIARLQAASTSR